MLLALTSAIEGYVNALCFFLLCSAVYRPQVIYVASLVLCTL